MQFAVQRGDLLKELQYVQGVVEKRTTVPILSNILLETTGNRLTITATDLDVTIRCGCAAQVKVSGAISIASRKLYDIIRLLPEEEVQFRSSEQDRIQVTCARSKFKIATQGKENFPDVPRVEAEPVTLPAGPLRFMIASTVFAITQEESRFALNGALLVLQPNQMIMVTTDGHRLALVSRSVEIAGLDGELRNLIPRKTLVELSKLAADEVKTVEFGRSENHLFFKIGERLLVSRILSGQFPNYEMVIPQDNTNQLLLETAAFTDALRRVAVLADEQSRAVRIALQTGQADIGSNSSDFGEAKESLPVDYEGEPVEVCFNAGYLLDFLTGLQSEQVRLSLKDGEHQGLLEPESAGDYTYQYVVMPMRI